MQKRYISTSPLRLGAALALYAVVASCAAVERPPETPTRGLVEDSTFVFEGTITALGATSVASVPVSPQTIVVKVDNVLDGPHFFKSFAERPVTVFVADPSGLARGSRAVFFADGWIVGSG